MLFNKISTEKVPVLFISFFVFLFGTLALVVPSGYTYGPVFLLLIALGYLFVRPFPALISADKYLLAALATYFVVGAITNAVHHLPSRHYDNASRFLFAIPVLFLLIRFPVKPIYLLSGVALGALGAGGVALMDFYVYGELRAGGFNNPIQFGDIAMLFSCLLMASFGWATQYSRGVVVLFVFGIVSGLIASLLSGARGGWLALPFGLVAFFVANDLHKNIKRNRMSALTMVCTVVVAYYFFAHDLVHARVNDALVDLHHYFQNNDTSTSLGSRLALWQASLNLIAEQPVLGWGTLANYLNESGDGADIFQRFNHFHNEFLDALVKRGVLGGAALLIIYVVPANLFYRQLKQCSPAKRPLVYAGLILVIATFVFGLTQSFFSHSSGVMIYAFMLVLLWAQVRSPDVNASSK